uniref:Uncharacterized protein n=1 Tax=Amblyomma maculatum TaxID=34609 RepID=G3MTK8_AMBMU
MSLESAASTVPSSHTVEAAEVTGAGELTAPAVDGTVESNPPRALNTEAVTTEQDLTALKARYSSAHDELEMLKTRAADLQTRCEKYEKTKDEISNRINNITAKIREEKSSKLEKLSGVEQRVQHLYKSLTQTVWTPDALEGVAEGLRAQKQDIEYECRLLDVVLERKQAELRKAQMQSTDNAAEEVILEPAEQQMTLNP